jgi:hypothetical protein
MAAIADVEYSRIVEGSTNSHSIQTSNSKPCDVEVGIDSSVGKDEVTTNDNDTNAAKEELATLSDLLEVRNSLLIYF